ncbi:MAG: 1-acyl-sn-glycerol-3-phosphate acyltransferase [Bacteroidales bacterium]
MANNTDTDTLLTGEKYIDIDNIIRSKNPNLLKILPRFILNYLKKIIHEKEINVALERYKDDEGLDFVAGILREFGVNINVINPENIPPSGRYIIASNHPLGGLDGLALMHVAGKVRRDIIFPVNDLLLNLKNLRSLFIPINKHGKNTDNIHILEETFASDVMVLYFPAGLCSRKQKGKILDLEWKNTFIKKSIQYKRDIIPVHIDGRNSNFFYNLATLRKRLGIKANIEMLYLVDEMFRQHNKWINITFGTPISYRIFDKKYGSKKWANLIKTHVYELEQDCSKEFIYKQ